MNNTTPEIKVGDTLAFRKNYGRGWEIYPVEAITPSGRIKCGRFVLNPDLRIRGSKGNYNYGPYRAEIVTDKIREEHFRDTAINEIIKFKLNELSTERLRGIVNILSEHEQETE